MYMIDKCVLCVRVSDLHSVVIKVVLAKNEVFSAIMFYLITKSEII